MFFVYSCDLLITYVQDLIKLVGYSILYVKYKRNRVSYEETHMKKYLDASNLNANLRQFKMLYKS